MESYIYKGKNKNSRYKCTVKVDTNVAETLKPSRPRTATSEGFPIVCMAGGIDTCDLEGVFYCRNRHIIHTRHADLSFHQQAKNGSCSRGV